MAHRQQSITARVCPSFEIDRPSRSPQEYPSQATTGKPFRSAAHPSRPAAHPALPLPNPSGLGLCQPSVCRRSSRLRCGPTRSCDQKPATAYTPRRDPPRHRSVFHTKASTTGRLACTVASDRTCRSIHGASSPNACGAIASGPSPTHWTCNHGPVATRSSALGKTCIVFRSLKNPEPHDPR